MPNGIDLILADHRRVEALFTSYAESGDGTIIGQVIDVLAAHDDAEHAALYPLAGLILGDATLIQRWTNAHSAVKKQIDHLKGQEGQPLAEAFETLRALVQAHVDDEEKNLLPALGEKATRQQLDGLGSRILQAKQRGG